MSAFISRFAPKSFVVRVFACLFVFASFLLVSVLLKTQVSTAAAPERTAAASAEPAAALPTPTRPVRFDFDGDRKADVAIWKPSDGTWLVFQSSTSTLAMQTWGIAGDRIVPADYDGDGKTDYAVYTPSNGMWSIIKSANQQAFTNPWGAVGDIPAPGDFDGDGKADLAVFRPSTGFWYVLKSSTGYQNFYAVHHGISTDAPVVGDYDNDGKDDVAVFRSSAGAWYMLLSGSGNSFSGQSWGLSGDIAVPGDYNGDGFNDFAIWRPSQGKWCILYNGVWSAAYVDWGGTSYQDVLAPADYEGDGKADYTVWRPSEGKWYIWYQPGGAFYLPQLGVAGDIPVPAAFVSQAGSNPTVTPTPTPVNVSAPTLGRARLSPQNETGGTNPYSGNYSWGTGLVNLPGRAGLDAGLALSYNSLVWTKTVSGGSNTIVFDADKSNVAPGFRFGFPVIEAPYNNEQTNVPTYLMVTGSGARVELRQTEISTLFESVDSSYLQLQVVGSGTPQQQSLVLRSTDGTRMDYVWKAGAYRCSKITDRNGNQITINHDGAGLLRTITDTLERVITVSYDNALNPLSITQTWQQWNSGTQNWQNTTHTWAAFSYKTIPFSYNFGGLTVSGPASGTNLKVLDKVVFADEGYYTFDYNSYGQVKQINRYAKDTHRLSYVAYDLTSDTTTAQSNCPRYTTRTDWAENWNIPNGQITTAYLVQPNVSYDIPTSPSAKTGTATLVQATAPDGTINKTYVYPAGDWKEGLPLASETFSAGVRKRWTWTDWTQDAGATQLQNPRVLEMQVGDGANTKKTKISYYDQFGLVNEVREYDSTAATELRKTVTIYNPKSIFTDLNGNTNPNDPNNSNAFYANRRIIGLISERDVYDKDSTLVSKMTYSYDDTGSIDTAQTISPIQHDNAYATSFVTGRGNLTTVTRWRIGTDTSLPASTAVSKIKYNTAGAPVSQADALNRVTAFSYTDSFNDNVNRGTYAYPTSITDPAGNSSTVQYRYDIGANVKAISPIPYGGQNTPNMTGKTTTRGYDEVGRLKQETVVNNGAYTRYEYPESHNIVKTYATAVAGQGEAKSEIYFDGHGRTRATRTELPGSTGGWTGQLIYYDKMGRVSQQSSPTEVNDGWSPAGDDYRTNPDGSVKWLWTSYTYDWKGRVLTTTNTDNSTTENTYEGCGCAGGEVATLTGEEIELNTNKRRKQKVYSDILGRQYKTEVLNWDGTVYTTTIQRFNALDQVEWTKQYATDKAPQMTSTIPPANLSCPNGDCREISMTYDGYNRLKTRHIPQQDAGKSTSYTYYDDNRVKTATDARGVKTSYEYETRGLLKKISYDVTNAPTVPLTTNVELEYDAAGNRKKMTDSLGIVDYKYNQLSQLTEETRQFYDYLPGAPLPNNSFRFKYSYELGGQLKSLTDVNGDIVNYSYDKSGRLQNVKGKLAEQDEQSPQLNYVTDAKYRAWGALKGYNYGHGLQMKQTFNERLQVEQYDVFGTNFEAMRKNYTYYKDGLIKTVQDELNPVFNRLNVYDHAGRIQEAKSSDEWVLGTTITSFANQNARLPYRQKYEFNVFGDLTTRDNLLWGRTSDPYEIASFNLGFSYLNNRINSDAFAYDADGRAIATTTSSVKDYTYDAAGRIVKIVVNSDEETPVINAYDGYGQSVKRTVKRRVIQPGQPTVIKEFPEYSLRSTVLGGELINIFKSGNLYGETNIIAGGTIIAKQTWAGGNTSTYYKHLDPSGMSLRYTEFNSSLNSPYFAWTGEDIQSAELDPAGENAGLYDYWANTNDDPPGEGCSGGEQLTSNLNDEECESERADEDYYWDGDGGPVDPTEVDYYYNGFRTNSEAVQNMFDAGSAIPRELNGLQGMRGFSFESEGLGMFTVTLPDIYKNKWGDVWSTAPGTGRQEGRRIFEGGSYIFGVSWNVSLQQQTRPQKPDYSLLQGAVDNCAQTFFGVRLRTPIVWTQKGRHGVMNFEVLNGKPSINQINSSNNTFEAVRSFSVYNDNTTFSRKDIANAGGFAPRQAFANGNIITGIYSFNETYYGKNVQASSNKNYTISDRDTSPMSINQEREGVGLGISPFVHTQIHEAGNSLAAITNNLGYSVPSHADPDEGAFFELCVLIKYKQSLKK